MALSDFFNERKFSILFSAIIIAVVSITYFAEGKSSMMLSSDSSLFEGIKIKVAIGEDNSLKLFGLAKSNSLAKYRTEQGNSIPEEDSIVIGSVEAAMMRDEKLFSKPGDTIKDLFGINVKVEGILKKTDTIIDDMHFLSYSKFYLLRGEEGKVFFKISDKGIPKAFYLLDYRENPRMAIDFEQGKIDDYKINEFSGKTYFPIILGSAEAEMMREERLFQKTGDRIDGFFGKNIIITGVLKKTGTSIDMMHIIPLKETELIGN